MLIKKAAGIERGAAKPNEEKVGSITAAQVEEIARKKLPDTNAAGRLASAMRMVEGTAKNMGVTIAA
jgi:large subunit ribosomal protein L11